MIKAIEEKEFPLVPGRISVVSPVYQAEEIVDELVKQLSEELGKITEDFEIILVDDWSRDNSWLKILANCRKDSRVKGVKLARNFGQHQAISAGCKYVTGEWVVIMDCDLQDRPQEIPRLYNRAQEGYEVVYAKRKDRQDSFFRLFFSDLFHRIFTFASGIATDRTLGNFGIYHRNVINEFNKLTQQDRSFPLLIGVLGFRSFDLPVQHSERFKGKSSYTFWRLFFTGWNTMISNSNRPLSLFIWFGFIIALVSFFLAAYNLFSYFTGQVGVPGFTTTVFSIWFTTGIIMANLGILGIYLGKVYDEVKGKPLFVVQREENIT